MTFRAPMGTFLLVTLVNSSAVWAQAPEDARDAVRLKVKRGDSITVTTGDGRASRGRFVFGGDDAMVLSVNDREVPFAWADIARVQRRRNGIVLGALIGIAAGAIAAYPAYWLSENETGDGAADAVTMVLVGAGAGIGIDALFSRNRTIYRRSGPSAAVRVEPRQAGGMVRLALTW